MHLAFRADPNPPRQSYTTACAITAFAAEGCGPARQREEDRADHDDQIECELDPSGADEAARESPSKA